MIVMDHNNEIQHYFSGLDDVLTGLVRLDLDSYLYANGIQDELMVVHAEIIKKSNAQVMAKLEEQIAILVFGDELEEKYILNNFIQFFSKDTPKEYTANLINHEVELLRERMILKSQLYSLNQELSDILGSVETELLRVKKIYETNTPRRYQDFKGIKVLSKYGAGESIGGEFFDIFKDSGKMFLLMSDTSSYLASSSILQLFTEFKSQKEINDEKVRELILHIKEDMMKISKNKKKPLYVNLLVATLDINTFEVEGYVFGKFHIMSSNQKNNFSGNQINLIESDIPDQPFKKDLSRGERLLVLSPGFMKCWEALRPEFMIEELMLKKQIKLLDILDEIFFQIKKNVQSGFLPHDASAIMLEVQQNVILQV